MSTIGCFFIGSLIVLGFWGFITGLKSAIKNGIIEADSVIKYKEEMKEWDKKMNKEIK